MACVDVPTWLLVLLALLAVARVTRLVVEDAILDGPRALVLRHARPGGLLAYLLGCPWCVSVWAGFGLAGLVVPLGDTWPVQVLVLGLAASQATGLLVPHTYPED